MQGLMDPGVDPQDWRQRWMVIEQAAGSSQWILGDPVVTRAYRMSCLPQFVDVEEGRLSGYADVIEGQCEYAIETAERYHAREPFDALIRFRVMLGGEQRLNTRVVPKALQAFFFLLGPGFNQWTERPSRSLQAVLWAILRIIPTSTIAIPHDMDDGGSVYDKVRRPDQVHWVVKATVDSHEEAINLLDRLSGIRRVHYPFVLVEEPQA